MLAFVVAVVVGYWRKLNTGIISIGLAFLIGHFLAGMSPTDIVNGWPLKLFFILLAMTFLFSIASVNGTLQLVARKVTWLAGGHRRLIPVVFFFLATVLAAMGPGNVAICALLLPIAMAVSTEEEIPPLLMAAMVICGSNAGGLSPIAPAGIIGITLTKELGMDTGMLVFVKQAIAQGSLAAVLYVGLRGFKLKASGPEQKKPAAFSGNQYLTLGVIVLVVAGIVLGKLDIGLTAFTGATILLLFRAADEKEAIAGVPWSTLILVCGVGVLVNVCRDVGGIDTLTNALSHLMNARTAAPIMAVTGGLMSTVSSASGVVMPALIPTAPGIAQSVGGDASEIITAIVVGSHMVTISPMSTLGALAMGAAGSRTDKNRLFGGLLALAGVALIYGALIVYLGIV